MKFKNILNNFKFILKEIKSSSFFPKSNLFSNGKWEGFEEKKCCFVIVKVDDICNCSDLFDSIRDEYVMSYNVKWIDDERLY